MFAKAYRIASCFTLPVVISSRSNKNVCKSAIGACVVVNRAGWILTSAHLIKIIQHQLDSVIKHSTYGDNVRKQEQDTVADKRFRKSKVHSFQQPSKDSVRNHSVWWGRDGAQLHDLTVLPATDLALGRLHPFDPASIAHYPTFKKPNADYSPGQSLCRLGFPFHEIKPTFDQEKNAFVLPQGAVPLPLFPLEGIFTRIVVAPMPGEDANVPGKFIETSSPGLMGQSGGPIVDSRGVVWALQSHTRHYPLGFSPPVPNQSKNTDKKEHQFLNVGLGVHSESILNLLSSRAVEHQVSD